jgi:hypothetical protein
MTHPEHVSGPPTRNPVTGARRYTGAEFAVRLWKINYPGFRYDAPKPRKSRRRAA